MEVDVNRIERNLIQESFLILGHREESLLFQK